MFHWLTNSAWAARVRARLAAPAHPTTPTTPMPPPEPAAPPPDLRLYDEDADDGPEADCAADACPCDCPGHCAADCVADAPGGGPSCCDGGCRRYRLAVEEVGDAAHSLLHTQASPDARLAAALAVWREVRRGGAAP